jgi:hypothetical protein
MGKLRTAWQGQKQGLSRVNASTPFLREDLGPKLDDFEAALSRFEKARATRQRSDPALQPLRAALKTATTRLSQTASVYEKELRYVGDHATDPRQKQALLGAADFLFHLFANEIKKAQAY